MKKHIENLKDRFFEHTPDGNLLQAANQGNIDKVQGLLDKGVSPNVTNKEGRTALHAVMQHKSDNTIDIVKILIAHLAKINAQDHDGETPLHLAVIYNQSVVVKYLMESGADPNIQNNYGQTALHCLVRGKVDKRTFEALFSNTKVDVNIKDRDGDTPLHLARDSYYKQELLKFKADVNIKNNDGEVPTCGTSIDYLQDY